MPPMLHIAFQELMGRAAQQVLAHELGLGVDKRHHVLQLIAKTEGASRLVVSAACPQTARYGLIQEPAVGQDVEWLIGCFHLNGAERIFPILPYRIERASRGSRTPEAMHQVPGVIGASTYAEPEDDVTLLPVGQLKRNLDRGAGIQS